MAKRSSSPLPMGPENATEQKERELGNQRVTCKSIKKMTIGCATRSRSLIHGNAESAVDDTHHSGTHSYTDLTAQAGTEMSIECEEDCLQPIMVERTRNTAYRQDSATTSLKQHMRETEAGAENTTAVSGLLKRHERQEEGSAEGWRRQEVGGRDSEIDREEEAAGRADGGDWKEEVSGGADGDDGEEEAMGHSGSGSGAESDDLGKTSAVAKLNHWQDYNSECLTLLLDPIQETVKSYLLEYSRNNLPPDAHQHMTNEVILVFENGQLNITINITCTMFMKDPDASSDNSLAREEDISGAAE